MKIPVLQEDGKKKGNRFLLCSHTAGMLRMPPLSKRQHALHELGGRNLGLDYMAARKAGSFDGSVSCIAPHRMHTFQDNDEDVERELVPGTYIPNMSGDTMRHLLLCLA
jgi:hypothetical protein